MEFTGVTFTGKSIKDEQLIARFPADLQEFLQYSNGMVAFDGGITFKGVGQQPKWASIEAAMKGEFALHEQYSEIQQTDIPFAHDCLGINFLLRGEDVMRLDTENGHLEKIEDSLWDFINNCIDNPEDYLDLELLFDMLDDGNILHPGELLHVNPPFSFEESEKGVEVAPVSWEEQMMFLFELNEKLKNSEDGSSVEIESLI